MVNIIAFINIVSSYFRNLCYSMNSCYGIIRDTALLAIKILPPPRVDDVVLSIPNSDDQISIGRDTSIAFPLLGRSTKSTYPLEFSVKFAAADSNTAYLIGKYGTNPIDAGVRLNYSPQINNVSGSLTWPVSCEQFLDLQGKRVQLMVYLNTKNECNTVISDSLPVFVNFDKLVISDQFSYVNVFTPDGNGLNEKFLPLAKTSHPCLGELTSVRIYNRWGTEVYYEESYGENPWNGNGYPEGLYYYQLNYKRGIVKGWVQLLR